MAHHYQYKGGSLMIISYSGLNDTQFSFYVYDPHARVAAYCWYSSDVDAKKLEEANLQSKIVRHQIGFGTQIVPLGLQKPLDLHHLEGTVCSLSLNGSGTAPGTADLLINKAPAIHLIFPVTADFSYRSQAKKSEGKIGLVKVVKTSTPELPAAYRAPVAVHP
jgi:hypothetical protein